MDDVNIQEKRRFERVTHAQAVQYQFMDSDRAGGSLARDLSEGGVRLRLNQFIPMNTDMILEIRLKGDDSAECVGRVVWVEKSRFGESYDAGLMFSGNDLNILSLKKIRGFISRP